MRASYHLVGVEPARARRLFRRHFGISFHAFCRAVRLSDALDELRRGAPIDEAVFESGYESHSGFRDAFARLFGATPGRTELAAPLTVTWLSTPMIAGADSERGVCLLEYSNPRALGPQLAALGRRHRRPLVPGDDPCLAQLREELRRYFAGELRRFTVPLALVGSAFQERVWSELLAIPYGETCSYELLAARVGRPGAARAVGSANGRNPVAIVVPCHRVVNKRRRARRLRRRALAKAAAAPARTVRALLRGGEQQPRRWGRPT
jgi:AraC family transcriptional regulator of adaptative response/methylated-DNA-[protein]-cysteine methyltransferase